MPSWKISLAIAGIGKAMAHLLFVNESEFYKVGYRFDFKDTVMAYKNKHHRRPCARPWLILNISLLRADR